MVWQCNTQQKKNRLFNTVVVAFNKKRIIVFQYFLNCIKINLKGITIQLCLTPIRMSWKTHSNLGSCTQKQRVTPV